MVAVMIRRAISATNAVLPSQNKGVYNLLAYLCEYMNSLLDICNERHGAHTPDNVSEHQHRLLQIIEWFSQLKKLHGKGVTIGETTKYNFFTHKTWRCIQSLIVAYVAIIQLYYVEKSESINLQVINTDIVEWFFGDTRNMVCGATNKLQVKTVNTTNRKAGAFNRGRHEVVGNNHYRTNSVFKCEQNRFNT